MDGRRSGLMYEARFTRQFIRATKKADHEALKVACREILADPYHARGSETLSYQWAGFRSAGFSRRDRIIYRICEECRQKRQQDLNPLGCCGDPDSPGNVVTFVDFGDYHASAGRRRILPTRSYEPAPEDEAPPHPDK
jgi:hypothetical protein